MCSLDMMSTPARSQWERIGASHHHGVNIPLFSLYSSKSCGIGEYPDLLLLFPWCRQIGFDLVQLLPLNDTGSDRSPYAALSAFALNPIHLGLAHLPFVEEDPFFSPLLKTMQGYSQSKRVDYNAITPLREYFLRNYYQIYGARIMGEGGYLAFLEANPWLSNYALYKTFKSINQGRSWEDWEPSQRDYCPEMVEKLSSQAHEEYSFHLFLQYLCFDQMKKVRAFAEENEVFLKGDLPILINRDSADVWASRTLFDLNYAAGAPPDFYSEEGQYWGFPIYNWEEMERQNYRWWKERLSVASQLYHLYRLDHLVGFFRIWAIPLGKRAIEGAFFPAEHQEMMEQGTKIMRILLESSEMMPIAEDLGTVPPEVRNILDALGICGTRVIRWERFWNGNKSFIPYDQYPVKSMTTISTHDSETVRGWWEGYPEDAKSFALFNHWEYTPKLSVEHQRKILHSSHHTSSLFHINLLQEYLDPISSFRDHPPAADRVNTPGMVSDANWSYKFPLSVEQIVSLDDLKQVMLDAKT